MREVCFLIYNILSIEAILFHVLCSYDTFPSLTYVKSDLFKVGFSHRTKRLHAIDAMF